MRRILLASLMGMLISSLALGVDIKSQIGEEDINWGTGTFQRRTSTGGTITLNKVDGTAIPDSTIDAGDKIKSGSIFNESIWWTSPTYPSVDCVVTSPGGHTGHPLDNTYKLSAPATDIRTFLPSGNVTDGSVAYTAQVRAAVAAAEDAGRMLYVPILVGVDNTITLRGAKFLGMKGEKQGTSGFKMLTNTVTAMITTDGAQNTRPVYKDMTFDANGKAGYALYLDNTDTGIFENIRCTGATTYGAFVGYGWDNRFLNSEFSYNSGGGLRLYNAVNGSSLTGNMIFANDKIGLDVYGAKAIFISGNTFEQNKYTGFIISNSAGVELRGNYYENNGQTGHTFTTPSLVAKVNGIFNGTADVTELSNASPVKGLNISGEWHINNTYTDNAAYLFAGVDGATIGSNSGYEGSTAFIWLYNDASYGSGKNISINGKQSNFSSTFLITNTAANRLSTMGGITDWSVVPRNYISDNYLSWGSFGGGNGGVFNGSSERYNGFNAFKFDNTSATGTTDFWGVTVDVDAQPELASKYVYFGAWLKGSSVNTWGQVFIGTNGGSMDYPITDWTWMEVTAQMPASGTANVGLRRLAVDNTDIIHVANPVLAIVGAPSTAFYPTVKPPDWKAASAPTTGSWDNGTIVYNTGTDNVIGWKYTGAAFKAMSVTLAP